MKTKSLLILASLLLTLDSTFAGSETTLNFSPSTSITSLEDAWSKSPTVQLDFKQAEMADIFDLYQAASGLELVVDSRARGKIPVTIQTSAGATKSEAMKLIDQALVSQAGVVITRLDDKTASVTFNDQLILKPLKTAKVWRGIQKQETGQIR